MYTVEIFFTHFAIWVKISPLGGGGHKISVQKQVRTAARGLVLIFAKVDLPKGRYKKVVEQATPTQISKRFKNAEKIKSALKMYR